MLLPNFSFHKNTIEIYLIYWNVLIRILPECLAFDKNPTKFKKYIYTYNLSMYCYQLFMLLFVRISPVILLSTTWRPNLWVLRNIWLYECLPFENHFFFYHKSESWIPCHIDLYCIFSKNFAVLKRYKILFHKNVLYLQDILITCNIWKHSSWTHFCNLVASFRRVRRQNFFCHA